MATVKREAEDEAQGVALGRLGSYLGFRLKRVQNQLARDFAARIKPWGLRSGMYSSLEIIAANPGISQAVLSTTVGLDKSAMVPLVDDMERRGWVVRTRSQSDRRRNHLSITDAGRDELDAITAELDKTEALAFELLSEDEKRVVSEVLDKVYDAYVRAEKLD